MVFQHIKICHIVGVYLLRLAGNALGNSPY
jgi:hypothetical protein